MSAPPIARRHGAPASLRADPANLVLLACLCSIVFACFFLIGRAASPPPRVTAPPSTPATTVASAPLSAGVLRVPRPAGAEVVDAKRGARTKAAAVAAGILATPTQPTPQPVRSAPPPVQPKPAAAHTRPAPTASFDSSG